MRNEPGIDIHDVIYTRPKDTKLSDLEINCIKWINDKFSNLQHGNTTFANHLYDTFCCMKHMGCSTNACLAGLFHSIYGTDFYELNMRFERNFIKDMIGDEAETLCYYFCEENRDNKIMNNMHGLPIETFKNLLYMLYANKIVQIDYVPFDFKDFSIIKEKILRV